MNDTNPLNLSPKKLLPGLNKSGRPAKDKVIYFGPQPQSFISQLIKKRKEDNIKITQARTLELTKEYVTPVQGILSSDEDIDSPEESSFGDISPQPHNKTPENATKKEKLYTCNYNNCTYSTRIASNLSKHKRTHTSEKPYLCDICSFQTKFVNSLKTHKRIHSDIRPYICIFCSYRCNSSSNLKKHCKHMHSDKSPKT